jgi:hypothetical protein
VGDFSEKFCHADAVADEDEGCGARRVLGRQRRQHFGIDFLLLVPYGTQSMLPHLQVEKISWAVEPSEKHSG